MRQRCTVVTALAITSIAAICVIAAPAAHAGDGYDKGKGKGQPGDRQTKDAEAVLFMQTLLGTRFGQNDAAAVESIGKLIAYWKDDSVGAPTKQSIPSAVAWYAKRKGPSVDMAVINGLAAIGKGPGIARLVTILEGLVQQKEPPADLVKAACDGLAGAADTDAQVTGAVLRLLGHKDRQIVVLGAGVLGAYREAPVATRKRLFEDALKTFEGIAAAAAKAAPAPAEKPADAAGQPPEGTPPAGGPAAPAAIPAAAQAAIDKWAAVRQPAAQALGALSHQQFADIAAARTWLAHGGREPDGWK